MVFDNAAGPAYCSTVRDEIMMLFEAGLLTPSKNKLATSRHADGSVADGHELPKIGVFELDVVVNGEASAFTLGGHRRAHHAQACTTPAPARTATHLCSCRPHPMAPSHDLLLLSSVPAQLA